MSNPITKVAYGNAFITGLVRLHHVRLAEKDTKGKNPSDKYSFTILIPKSDKDTLKECFAAICELSGDANIQDVDIKHPFVGERGEFKDGDIEKKAQIDGYAGHVFLQVRSNKRPALFIKDDNEGIVPITEKEDIVDHFYNGAYCLVALQPATYTQKGGGITFYPTSVIKVKDGAKLSEGSGASAIGEQNIIAKLVSLGITSPALKKEVKEVIEDDEEEVVIPKPKTKINSSAVISSKAKSKITNYSDILND